VPIKNKDGTVYRLSGPNPLARTQEWTPADKLIFHNFRWEPVSVSAEEITPVRRRESVPVQEELKVITPEPTPVAEPEVVPAPEPEPTPAPVARNQVVMHCVPAVISLNKDDLYGESYRRTTWGGKVTFEAIVTGEADLTLQFWTTYGVTKGSVVFPARYVATGRGYGEHRWWKITSVERKEKGFLCEAVPSDYTPDFSD
jgi:hypothetical protein